MSDRHHRHRIPDIHHHIPSIRFQRPCLRLQVPEIRRTPPVFGTFRIDQHRQLRPLRVKHHATDRRLPLRPKRCIRPPQTKEVATGGGPGSISSTATTSQTVRQGSLAGLSNSSMSGRMQQSEQVPQLRPSTSAGPATLCEASTSGRRTDGHGQWRKPLDAADQPVARQDRTNARGRAGVDQVAGCEVIVARKVTDDLGTDQTISESSPSWRTASFTVSSIR